jgi:transposase InsO family protein
LPAALGDDRVEFAPLLRNLPVIRPNQVWAMDITYIPTARGFVYLAAVAGSRLAVVDHHGSGVLHRGAG